MNILSLLWRFNKITTMEDFFVNCKTAKIVHHFGSKNEIAADEIYQGWESRY